MFDFAVIFIPSGSAELAWKMTRIDGFLHKENFKSVK